MVKRVGLPGQLRRPMGGGVKGLPLWCAVCGGPLGIPPHLFAQLSPEPLCMVCYEWAAFYPALPPTQEWPQHWARQTESAIRRAWLDLHVGAGH